ncbi:hypothetical protein ACVWY5_001129 [Bradyrhizobium sp. USDA 3256]
MRFSVGEDGLSPVEVDIGRSEVVDALMIADVIVVFYEGPYLPFEVTRAGSNDRAECGSSRLGASARSFPGSGVITAAHMLHALVFEPTGQIVCHVTQAIVA